MEMDDEFLEVNDLDWFAISRDGFVLHFSTGGKGPIPSCFKRSIDRYELALEFFSCLKGTSEAEIVFGSTPVSFSGPQDNYFRSFCEMAKKGFFSYDFRVDCYELIAKPLIPLSVSDIPSDVRNIVPVLDVLSGCVVEERNIN